MNDGYLLIDKPVGVTSFEALYPIKRALGTGKVGHTGTLDKFASGLMVVLTGRALKQSMLFTHLDKRYEAAVLFGEETDTLDPEGAVVERAPPPTLAAIEAVLPLFRGPIMQAPPAYSAIHVGGKRAHALSRAGAPPVMEKRQVTIHALELLSYDVPLARLAVHCSSGTYIRSLARDIALAAASRARLDQLRRTTVGPFAVTDAVISSAEAADDCGVAIPAALQPLTEAILARLPH
jgi:tRNA pseudouridine55 synthase